MATRLSELDLDYQRRFPGVVIPDAYPRLLLEAIQGDQQHFVRRDELRAAWAAFDPLLKALDAQAGGGEGEDGEEGGEKTANKKPAAAGEKAPRIPVHAYPAGSRGPPEADALLARVGYVRPKEYHWRAAGAVERPERP
jgi:glucose-6-phosphate 1-dehydrogenase